MTDLKNYLDVALEAVDSAVSIVSKNFGKRIDFDTKSGAGDWVSEVDVSAEKAVRVVLEKHTPDFGVVGEELGSEVKEFTWYVDPLDGTNNYLRGVPIYGVSLGLALDGEPVLGVIADPQNNDVYTSVQHQGAFRNGDRIQVSDRSQEESIIILNQIGLDEEVQKVVLQIEKEFDKARMIYCGTISQLWFASGKYDAFFCDMSGGGPWDFVAGVSISREAGGIVTDFQGNHKDLLDSKQLLFGNDVTHPALLSLLEN